MLPMTIDRRVVSIVVKLVDILRENGAFICGVAKFLSLQSGRYIG